MPENKLNQHSIDYSEMVRTLAKSGIAIIDSLTRFDCHLLPMAVGAANESGELLDAVKKAVTKQDT